MIVCRFDSVDVDVAVGDNCVGSEAWGERVMVAGAGNV